MDITRVRTQPIRWRFVGEIAAVVLVPFIITTVQFSLFHSGMDYVSFFRPAVAELLAGHP